MGEEIEEGLENARLVGRWTAEDCRLHEAVRRSRALHLEAAGVTPLLAAELQAQSALGLPASADGEALPEGYQLETAEEVAGLLPSGEPEDEAGEWLRRRGAG